MLLPVRLIDYGLRDYGTARWEGGDAECKHYIAGDGEPGITHAGEKQQSNHGSMRTAKDTCPKCGAIRIDNQLGLEQTPDEYVANMVSVFREIKRVLKSQGTVWIVIGDSYASAKSRYSSRPHTISNNKDRGDNHDKKPDLYLHGYKDKDLIGIPWRVAFALQADGWWLRSDIIWHKTNPMPESVKDRPTKSHEYIFLLAKSQKYYYDAEAILEPHAKSPLPRALRGVSEVNKWNNGAPGSTAHTISKPRKNNRKEWEQEHGGSGDGFTGHSGYYSDDGRLLVNPNGRNKRSVWTVSTKSFKEAHFATYPPDLIEPCILAGCPIGGIVLDPFSGSGTTVMVAIKNNRRGIGIDLNTEYIKMAKKRINGTEVRLL